ncbi:MAG: 30S ribosomal protein S13 [Thermoplasmata archaeon]|jgi:small subunit ribosomal protein S13
MSPAPPETKPAKTPTPPAPTEEAKPSKKEKSPKAGKEPKGKDGKESKEGKDGKETKGGKGKGGSAKAAPVPDNPNFRYIVRVSNTDLDGRRPTALAIARVRGVGHRIAGVVCRLAEVDPKEMIGNLPEPTVERIEASLGQIATRLPAWMINHPKETVSGQSLHFFGPDLETSRRDDINWMRMIRSYRGVRHERGQKVRGQRTRSNGRTGMAAGVIKKTAREAQAESKGKSEPAAAAPATPPAKKE